ncbi:phosphoribosylanthranilate isomerase [Salinimicrobium sp. MT39]|uniref:N-(5'-phosphoribosyl)anthranilate isomerase n=1 Tax=Salinimicrobium profundisediminis TaxID=2994553 RepID=A0A9X3HZ95_9FLAO|nr:phosphoribosylanthranilate isomerase [Salinimicrobium profundisediminis]MCX2836690.1 phosphoribosylanthranilate isomerase [Salinimicrobium profundisediminis]
MNLKLKICGMREPENMSRIAALHPDYLGLIFFEGSPRNVVGEIFQGDQKIKKTGVFVNASEENILEKIEKYQLSALQLHGEESPEFINNLKQKISEEIELIKVFSIGNEFDFEKLQPYEGVVDYFLFDTLGKSKGGNGIRFNWDVLQDYPSTTPFFLSGGIGPDDAAAVKELYHTFQKRQKEELFYGIDINSKFETAPAVKDAEALKTFRERLYN